MLIVGQRVTEHANDKEELKPTLESIPEQVPYKATEVLVDSGYYAEDTIKKTEKTLSVTVYSAVERTSHHKSIEDLEAAQEEPKTFGAF